jgi:RNA polymerase sigma-70 factor (ECF subfamily)
MDESSVAEAYRLYAPAIWRRCVGLLGSEAEALDVAQEVFVRCLRHHRRLRPGRELLGWLYRVATNVSLNHLRNQKTRGHAESTDTIAEPSHEGEATARLMVADLLHGLDRRTQELVVYVLVDGMTHAEAAELGACSERTVRNRLNRFLARGRRVMGMRTQEGS